MLCPNDMNQKLTFSLFRLPVWISKNISQVQSRRSLTQRLLAWFQSEYDEHVKSWEEHNERDFLDLYIGEHKKANEEQNDKSSFFGEMGSANFLLTMYDLFLAGSETTSTTLTW